MMKHSIEGLEQGILNHKKNIKVLETAIEKERQAIADYRIMISEIQEAKEHKAEAEANVHAEIDGD